MSQEMELSRRRSDQDLVDGGAYYIKQKNGENLLVVTEEQIERAREEMNKEILKTAIGTSHELGNHTDIPYAKEISKRLSLFGEEFIRSGLPFFVELRYKCSEKILKDLIENHGVRQIIELAPGFTPHGINTLKDYPNTRYIEADYGADRKREIVSGINPSLDIDYVDGNFLNPDVQKKIKSLLDDGPVAIFSEGLMMYMDEENRKRLGVFVREILEKYGGFFFFEDNSTFNPDFKERLGSIMAELHKKLSMAGKTSAHQKSWTQEQITQEFEEMGFDVKRIPENNVELSTEKYPYRDLSKSKKEQEDDAKNKGEKYTKEQIEKIIEDAKNTFKMWVLTLKK